MKPFNLEAALAGAKVVTRDGNKVEIGCYNKDYNSLLGWIDRVAYTWTGGGKSVRSDDTEELFMAPTERKEWVVRTGKAKIYGPYGTEDHAIKIQRCEGGTIHEITIHE